MQEPSPDVYKRQGVRRSLLAGVDTIEHGSVLDDELIGMFRHNPNALRGYSALVPTLSAGLPPVSYTHLDVYKRQRSRMFK